MADDDGSDSSSALHKNQQVQHTRSSGSQNTFVDGNGQDDHTRHVKDVSGGDGSPSGSGRSTGPVTDRESLLVEDEPGLPSTLETATRDRPAQYFQKSKEQPVGWRDLPKKGQLAILTLSRLSEPLSERSLAAYLFYQLRSFDPSLSDSQITSQGGLLTAAFAGSQFITAVLWGRVADSPRVGRKKVILIGLVGSSLSTLGVGFSKSFGAAITWRLLAGALNGNSGVMRTMVSEMIAERKYQSRAFLLLPMTFNVGVAIGPLLGGFLADPVHSFPRVFGPGSVLGGRNGVGWMQEFPYAFPNVFTASIIFLAVTAVTFGLDETHHALRHQPDWGRRLGAYLYRKLRRRDVHHYQVINTDDTELQGIDSASVLHEDGRGVLRHEGSQADSHQPANIRAHTTDLIPRTGFLAILKSNIILTLCSHHLLALHISAFNALIFLFLPNPISDSNPSHFSLRFSGGLGMSSSKVGMATAIMGMIGIPFQIFSFPRINAKLGTLRSYRYFLPFSGLAYTVLPFLALFPHRPYLMWPALALVLAFQVMARTFALPSTTILINNSSPSPAVLGTIHGLAQSIGSGARMLGPTVGGMGLGLGLRNNCVGAVWWAMAGVVGLNWLLLWTIWEGDGRGGRQTG